MKNMKEKEGIEEIMKEWTRGKIKQNLKMQS